MCVFAGIQWNLEFSNFALSEWRSPISAPFICTVDIQLTNSIFAFFLQSEISLASERMLANVQVRRSIFIHLNIFALLWRTQIYIYIYSRFWLSPYAMETRIMIMFFYEFAISICIFCLFASGWFRWDAKNKHSSFDYTLWIKFSARSNRKSEAWGGGKGKVRSICVVCVNVEMFGWKMNCIVTHWRWRRKTTALQYSL